MPEKASYWVAAHLTGIFEIMDSSNNILEKGSRGAGLSINRGVQTSIKRIQPKNIEIYFNGQKQILSNANITTCVLDLMLSKKEKSNLYIEHDFEVPLSSGFGASASGALGTAFALNDIYEMNKSEIELFQTAHRAEVLTKSGLGDIIGLYQGGLEIRSREGAPGYGKTMSMNNIDGWNVATVHFGPLSTAQILTDPQRRKAINLAGNELISNIVSNPKFSNFVKLAGKFTKNVGLWSNKLQEFARKVPPKIFCAQIMLGEGLFLFFQDESELNHIKVPGINIIRETICEKTVVRK